MPRRLLVSVVFLVIVLTVGFVAVTYAVRGNPLDPFDDRRFSTSAWRTTSADGKAPMARSAIRDHLRPGLSQAELVALLGEPGARLTGKDAGGNGLAGSQTYSYYLGSWSIYGFDDAFLYVHLDSDGRIISAEVNGY